MTDPDQPDQHSNRLPTGSHHDRAKAERIAEARSMIALWDRAVFCGKKDAREQLAFWRGVLREIEGGKKREGRIYRACNRSYYPGRPNGQHYPHRVRQEITSGYDYLTNAYLVGMKIALLHS